MTKMDPKVPKGSQNDQNAPKGSKVFQTFQNCYKLAEPKQKERVLGGQNAPKSALYIRGGG